jgi:hypothetical protein
MPNPSTKPLCILFIVIGLVVVAVGIRLLARSLGAELWPVTNGMVRSARMNSQSGHHSRTYSAEITYGYQVAGIKYEGDKVAIGQMSADTGYASGILDRYPVGKEVSVHYSPGDPADAVLEPGIHGGTWICLGVGTAFTLFGFLFLQIQRAALRGQLPGGRGMDQPPVLMGVILLLAGIGLAWVPPGSGKPGWLMYAVGAVFFCGGIMLLLYRLENKTYSQLASFAC